MSANAPQERTELIHAIYGVEKAVEPFVLVTDKQELFHYLKSKGMVPEIWGTRDWPGTRSFDELWEEYQDEDSVLAVMRNGDVARFIRTITLYIYRDKWYPGHAKPTREILREFVLLPGRPERERHYANSASEKMKWFESDPLDAIRRLLTDELGLRVIEQHLREPLLLEVPDSVSYMKDGKEALKIDIHQSHAYPGIVTHNRLCHYMYKLVKRYWEDVYREVQDRKILEFRWKSTNAPDT